MITIDIERCTGCGACVEICPTGALYLVNGKAAVDEGLCRECEACPGACPTRAIVLTERPAPIPEQAHPLAPRREPDVIHVRTQPAPVPLRAQVLPVVGAALAWAGREIVPRLADALLETLDRRQTGRQTAATTTGPGTGILARGQGGQGRGQGRRGGQGRRQRHRRRGTG